MCVLVVPDELKGLQQKQQAKSYSEQFDGYWQSQAQDTKSLVEFELEQDKSFLDMVRQQPLA